MSKNNNYVFKFANLQFEENVSEHINKMPFSGVCLHAEQPSDGVPCGSDKPVQFAKEAIQNALNSFIGMGVNVEYSSWDYPEEVMTGHNPRFKIGVVESAELLENGDVFIKGSLWKQDFYDVCFMIKNAKDSLGFSVEVSVDNMRDSGDFYNVDSFTFTGVAILYKNLAAFAETQLSAQKKKESDTMDKEQFEQLLACMNGLTESMKDVVGKLDAIQAKEVDFSKVIEKVEEVNTKIQASAQPTPAPVPNPKATGFVGKGNKPAADGKIDFSAKREEIMNDANIPENMKAQACVKAYAEMLKSE